MPKGRPRKSTADWEETVLRLEGENYKVIGEYAGEKDPVTMWHKGCEGQFPTTPERFRNGNRCPKCSKKGNRRRPRMTAASFQERMDEVHGRGSMELTGPFADSSTRADVRHVKCGHTFPVVPRDFVHRAYRAACPRCKGGGMLTQEQFEARVAEAPEGRDYRVLGRYRGTMAPVEMLHLRCDVPWEAIPHNFLKLGTRCPRCADSRNSKLSKRIEAELERLVGKEGFETESPMPGGPVGRSGRALRFDFHVPSARLLIEADGRQHEAAWAGGSGPADLRRTQEYDRRRDDWAQGQSEYRLLRVSWRARDPEAAVRAAVEAPPAEGPRLLLADRRPRRYTRAPRAPGAAAPAEGAGDGEAAAPPARAGRPGRI